jgi:uncharacterized HAD superfamily protein
MRSQRLKIGIDLDGVVASFESRFAPILSRLSHISFPLSDPNFPPVWDWPEYYGCGPAEINAAWENVIRDPGFWVNLVPTENAAADLERLYNLHCADHAIYFITTRVGIACKQQSEKWLANQGFPRATVIVSKRKGDIAAGIELDLFIDDKWENLDDVVINSPATKCYLLNKPYNQMYNVRRRVNTVGEMLDAEGL